MRYSKTVNLKNNAKCVLRACEKEDGKEVLELFLATHDQTDFLLTYTDENHFTADDEAKFLAEKAASEKEIELCAVVNGKIVATAGISAVGDSEKIAHRAEFGIAVDKEFQGLGIGKALTSACIDCAKKAGYLQLELDVVAANSAAISLYKGFGFKEYGRNPWGFRSRFSGRQELCLMRLELTDR